LIGGKKPFYQRAFTGTFGLWKSVAVVSSHARLKRGMHRSERLITRLKNGCDASDIVVAVPAAETFWTGAAVKL